MQIGQFLPRPLVGAAVALLLAGNGAAWYQLAVRSERLPSFDQGGTFRAAAVVVPDETTTTTAPTTSAPSTSAPPTPVTAPANSYAPGALPEARKVAPPPADSPEGVLPALGTAEWKVTGTEGATGFGRRTLPAKATVVTHAGEGGQVVVDTNYSSDHQERLIVADQGGTLAATYEGGQVRFGPMAQTNAGRYDPAMAYVPADLRPGVVVQGTTRVLDGDGNVQRTETWSVKVVGQTTIPVVGAPTRVWEVLLERQTTADSGQQVTRSRRQWWDPNRRAVVKYRDVMHGQQKMGGFTFTFDADITAELLKFTAA